MTQVQYDARTLSSGTIASLIHSNQYADIDAAQSEFSKFVDAHPNVFNSWQDAWAVFVNQQIFVKEQ